MGFLSNEFLRNGVNSYRPLSFSSSLDYSIVLLSLQPTPPFAARAACSCSHRCLHGDVGTSPSRSRAAAMCSRARKWLLHGYYCNSALGFWRHRSSENDINPMSHRREWAATGTTCDCRRCILTTVLAKRNVTSTVLWSKSVNFRWE